MKLEQKALAGGYAPIYADVTPEPVIEAFAVQVPHVEFVELHAPATLPGGYELSVQVGGDHMVVLVVSSTCVTVAAFLFLKARIGLFLSASASSHLHPSSFVQRIHS